MEDSAQVALAATVLPACKLIVGTFEESKFHAYAIVIKFGVEITTSVSGRAQKRRSGRKETEKRGLLPLFLVGGQKRLWGPRRKWATHSLQRYRHRHGGGSVHGAAG